MTQIDLAALVPALLLLALLAIREVARVSDDTRLRALARALNLAIIPPLVVFLTVVALRLYEAFS
jgi:hypothetical protein